MRLLALTYVVCCLYVVSVHASGKRNGKEGKPRTDPLDSHDTVSFLYDGEEPEAMETFEGVTHVTFRETPSKGSQVNVSGRDQSDESGPSWSEGKTPFTGQLTPRDNFPRKSEKTRSDQERVHGTHKSPQSQSKKGSTRRFGKVTIVDDYLRYGDDEDVDYQRILEESIGSAFAGDSHSRTSGKKEPQPPRLLVPEVPLPEGLAIYGLKNRQNYCFLSSILQVLYHMPGVYDWVIGHHSSNILHMGIAMLFARLNPQFNKRNPGAQDLSMDLTHIITALAKLSGASFQTGTADDVSEFWTWLHRSLPELFSEFFAMGTTTWQEVGGVLFQPRSNELDRLIAYVQGPETPIHELISGKEPIKVHVWKKEVENEFGLDDYEMTKGNVWKRLKSVLGDALSDTNLNVLEGFQHTIINKSKILVIQSLKAKVGDKGKTSAWDYSKQTPYEPIIEVGEEGDKEEYQLVATVNYLPGHFVAHLIVSYEGVLQDKLDGDELSASWDSKEFQGANDSRKGGVTEMAIDTEIKDGDSELEGDRHLKGKTLLGEPHRDVDVRRGVWAILNDSSFKGTTWDAPYLKNESPYFFFYAKTNMIRDWCMDPRFKTRRVPDKIAEALQLMLTGHDLHQQVLKRTQKFSSLNELKLRWNPPYQFVSLSEGEEDF